MFALKKHNIKVKLSRVASELDGVLKGEDIEVTGLCIPEEQSEGSICMISTKQNVALMKDGQASAYLVVEGLVEECDKPIIFIKDAKAALVKILNAIYPPKKIKHDIAKYVVTGKGSKIHKPCEIDNFVNIGKNTTINENTVIGSSVSIGNNVVIGKNCIIYPNVTIYDDTIIGDNVIIHAGAVIGADGFGFIPGANPTKIPQKGNVIIEDFVEIGANTCIDRATIGSTVIGFGTKLDDLVMVGHNTKLGKACLIASQVGFSGSIKVGDYVMAGGQAGFADHIEIVSGAIFGGRAGVANSIKEKAMYLGAPCMEFKKFAKSHAVFQELPDLKRRIRNLEK